MKYPRFLQSSPSIAGLRIFDLVLIAISLSVSFLLGFSSLVGLVISALLIMIFKIISKYIDTTGLLLKLSKNKNLDWMEEIRRISG